MSAGAAVRPLDGRRTRRYLAPAGVTIGVLACVPNLLGAASGSEVAQTSWYALMALVAPPLIVLGATRSLLIARDAAVSRLVGRGARARAERRGLLAAVAALVVDLVVIVWWRTPALVSAMVAHPTLVLAESATLVVAGVGLWLELVDLPTRVEGSGRPQRAVLAALAMWTVWTLAYVEGMSATGWYHAFRHVPGAGLSAAADREASAALLWAVATVVFTPVVFWNLSRWLRAESTTEHSDPHGDTSRSLGRTVST
jgi:cytochrome c oxidase assembly factor CtaG